MLVKRTVGELAHLFGGEVERQDVETPLSLNGKPFRVVGLVDW